MVPDDTRVRRRGSPTRREFDMAVKQCDEVKEHCRNKNRVVRMFFLAPPVLLLIGALAGRRQAEPSLGGGGGGLARHRGLYPAQQLTENPVAEWTMSPSVAFQITNELQSLHWDKSLESLTTFMSDSKKIVSSHLQKEDHLWQMLKDLHNETSPTSAVVLKNLAIDPVIPKTPTDGSKSLQKQTFVAEAMLLSLGELSGAKVVGYSAEKEYSNPWVHEGFPRDGVGSALTAPAELSYHQDMSYQESIPDILGLYCLREGHDTDVFTTLVDVREIIAQLPSYVVSILRQERFQIRTSDWVDASSVQVQQGRAILDGFSLHLPVHWENMIGLDEDAKTALALLQEAIIAAEPHKVHFEPGMLVFFNNQRVVHGRTPYTDLRFDGGDRVLNRAYFRRELSPPEEVTRMI